MSMSGLKKIVNHISIDNKMILSASFCCFHGKSILESLDRRNFDNARAICNLHSRNNFALV